MIVTTTHNSLMYLLIYFMFDLFIYFFVYVNNCKDIIDTSNLASFH